jgi:DNA-directed RNA polymerase specialized sigma24 family protein
MTKTRRDLLNSTERHRKAEQAVHDRRNARDDAIKRAYLAGVGPSEIAELTGLSRPYVHMLVREVKPPVLT